MSDLTLYKSCLRKIAINLKDGIYKSCHDNPFSVMPSKIVNDIMSAALDHQRADGLKADDLEQLLTSGKLRELKISKMWVRIDQLQTISQILNFLKSGSEKLEILHLTVFNHSLAWLRSEVSVARTRSEVFVARLRSEVAAALENLLRNMPNLADLHCCFSFDLKALENCQKLRSLRLHFEPQQHWYEFLAKDKDHFQTHKHLEFFTVCQIDEYERIPYDDVAIILRHCPALTSLGFIESSEALSQLHGMGISPSGLKLRHCFWRDREYDVAEYPSKQPNHGIHRVREAVLYYPMMQELDFHGCCLRSISCLRNLGNLVCLDITLDDNISGIAFNDALQVIGPQLKHLSLHTYSPMDISLLLQNCHNLESLRIVGNNFSGFSHPTVRLPNLQRLTFDYILEGARRLFSLLSDCNRLTELFLLRALHFDDQTLNSFLERNSLSNLKVAYLKWSRLSMQGFRKFLLNAPQLEIVETHHYLSRESNFERVIRETNHRALCNEGLLSEKDEFFGKRCYFYDCECY